MSAWLVYEDDIEYREQLLLTPLMVLGNQMGFRVVVMLQNPRRPKGTKGEENPI